MKSIVSLITTILMAVVMGSAFAAGLNVNPVATTGGLIGMSFVHGAFKHYSGAEYGLREGVNKEIWLPEILEGFYPDSSFLSKSRDLSAFVENDKIHLAEAGVDPDVLWNNAVWPIPIAQRTDTDNEYILGTLDSENTLVRNVEAMEANYDKMASVAKQHRNAIMKQAGMRAAHAYGAQAHSADTPIIETTGALVGGVKQTKLNDIIDLADLFDGNEWHGDRVLLLTSTEANNLRKEDLQLFKTIMSDKKQGFDLFGFTTFIYNFTPVYDSTDNTKKAFGAAAAGTDVKSAIAYLSDEVFRADGSVDMFLREKDPEQRGDIIGFQKRFLAGSLRGKCTAALVQGT